MWEFIKILAYIVVIVWLLELLSLPDWIAKRFKGSLSRDDMTQKIKELESRVADLEEKFSKTQS